MSEFKTNWFQGNIQPKRKGVYEVYAFGCSELYKYYDGKKWGAIAANPNVAFEMRDHSSIRPKLWRGLANKP